MAQQMGATSLSRTGWAMMIRRICRMVPTLCLNQYYTDSFWRLYALVMLNVRDLRRLMIQLNNSFSVLFCTAYKKRLNICAKLGLAIISIWSQKLLERIISAMPVTISIFFSGHSTNILIILPVAVKTGYLSSFQQLVTSELSLDMYFKHTILCFRSAAMQERKACV